MLWRCMMSVCPSETGLISKNARLPRSKRAIIIHKLLAFHIGIRRMSIPQFRLQNPKARYLPYQYQRYIVNHQSSVISRQLKKDGIEPWMIRQNMHFSSNDIAISCERGEVLVLVLLQETDRLSCWGSGLGEDRREGRMTGPSASTVPIVRKFKRHDLIGHQSKNVPRVLRPISYTIQELSTSTNFFWYDVQVNRE